MRILVLGITGQLGWEIHRRCQKAGIEVAGFSSKDADLTNQASVLKVVDGAQPDVVVNAAAYTNVDQAESGPKTAMAVNRDGPGYLAEACAKADIPLIHISTDYVFNGKGSRPYREDDPIDPLGVYGQTKALGESRIRERLERHVIIRTSWLYGVYGRNFVKTMLRLGAERKEISVVDDQTGCPTFAGDLADATIQAVNTILDNPPEMYGTYHFCNQGQTTWHGFAGAIFKHVRGRTPLAVEKVLPITTDQYPTPAQRPAYSVLDTSKFTRVFQKTPPPWEDSLAEMLEEVLELQKLS
jgi:dTDP-4-dehydrorhamnose reductase